jgi:serine/threonine protein kinase
MKELSLSNCRLDKRYDIRDSLGQGSYAEIFLARDTLASPESPHCNVVIKALNVFLQDDLDADLERTLVENFQNEALALDRVRHPNIISRLGHGTARDLKGAVFHYLILEYLSGGNLQSHIRREKLDPSTALNYVEQVCAGLRHAHSKGVIHRDIKPQNLLLSADLKTVKIADFGVARFAVSDSPITRVGTNIYAPPEHSPLSAGKTGELGSAVLSPAADVYSLAKTVFTLLIGEAPRAFVNEQITSLPESFEQHRNTWSIELARVLKKATSPDPMLRHQSVDEFWSDLEAVRRIVGESASSAPTTEALPRPHVSRGYTPTVPAAPAFESEPKISIGASEAGRGIRVDFDSPAVSPTPDAKAVSNEVFPAHPFKKDRPQFRRAVTFFIVVGIFTGLLYGTATYMRGRGVLPQLGSLFRSRTAVANTDIYLRPSPSTENDPIGLVTKDSKVRIVNSQNNWYQVDVIEQGRVRPTQPSSSRGWLNGKYLDIESN